MLHSPYRPQSDSESEDENSLRFTWPPAVGIGLGIAFIVAGVLIWGSWLGSNWSIEPRIRIILGITIILYGIWRIVVFLPRLNRQRRKSLREQIDELEEK